MSSTSHPRPAGTDCDLGAIDDLACSAKGIQRRAEVTQEHLPQLREFQEKLGAARVEYAKARHTAQGDLEVAGEVLDRVREQIRCRITPEQRHCLREAVEEVFEEISECSDGWGCCVDDCDCDFDDGVGEDDTVATLSARIARYTAEVLRDTACFVSLDGELTALPERAARIRTDAAQLLADAADPVVGKDVVRLYARLLVLRRRIHDAWRGFATVSAYVECLCKVLLCVLKGWQAIAVLEGARAELMCKEESRKAACLRKRNQVVEEVMAAYSRLCPPCPPGHGDGSEEEPCEESDPA
ncbi:hypothetical protein ACIBEA_02705 [Streptomyces sp. NPDC051555]|uniref:hypothetical protein n=1 Tax=Streptomyces sp. NPDC051555 TaxID=3365657 RepID=UPI0037A3D4E4